jgi:putative endonuclease
MAFWTYIVASKRNGTLYTGHTDNLYGRIWLHKTGALKGFTKTYGCTRLVWFECFETRSEAFARERRIKEWRRSWKLMLIEETNPEWDDLYDKLHEEPVYVPAESGSRHSPG